MQVAGTWENMGNTNRQNDKELVTMGHLDSGCAERISDNRC